MWNTVKSAGFKKFVSRGGARNPGSKEVPKGSQDCFDGLVFVLTGVYESLEREEMFEIIKNLGGKVTTSVSKNTSFLVVGEEAGECKLARAKTIGTKLLTEDEFLNLLRQKTKEKTENKTHRPAAPKVAKSVLTPDVEALKFRFKIYTKEDGQVDLVAREEALESKIAKSETISTKQLTEDVKSEPNAEVKPTTAPKKEDIISAASTTYEGQVDLWVDKYKPANSKSIIGQQGDKSNMNKLKTWLNDWNKNNLNLAGKKGAPKPAPWGAGNGAWAKCTLLSGPPGV